jgi:hypothetical protein
LARSSGGGIRRSRSVIALRVPDERFDQRKQVRLDVDRAHALGLGLLGLFPPFRLSVDLLGDRDRLVRLIHVRRGQRLELARPALRVDRHGVRLPAVQRVADRQVVTVESPEKFACRLAAYRRFFSMFFAASGVAGPVGCPSTAAH